MLPNFQLIQAIKSGCLADFNAAMARGASPESKDHDGRTALQVALRHDQPDLGKRLIEDGANPHGSIGSRGEHLIHLAVQTADIGFVTVLLDAGVSASSIGNVCRTPLHIASKRGLEYIATALLDRGAGPNASDAQGNTPLHVAAKRGSLTMTRLLTTYNANALVTNNQLYTPIHEAAANGHTEVAKWLLNREHSHDSNFRVSGILQRVQRVADRHNQAQTSAELAKLGPTPIA
ncbi:ankyrin repeat domain-containing protein [Rhodopirellula bahusiensis]|uniref:ankyrin repeat domain-containing protein n=1 Tax=Rhodopirellula bahusiensis TaxID=2014065 RepID=UPI0032669BB3